MSFNKYDKELIRMIILDHYENPKQKITNQLELNESYLSSNLSSPSCIDNLTAHVKIENDTIQDIKFSGVGCVIATSSTDIMSQLLINKSVKQAKEMINTYFEVADGLIKAPDQLEELYVYENIHLQANRIKCAKVGIQAILNAINLYSNNYEKTSK